MEGLGADESPVPCKFRCDGVKGVVVAEESEETESSMAGLVLIKTWPSCFVFTTSCGHHIFLYKAMLSRANSSSNYVSRFEAAP